jgi:uncharacterized protein
VRCPIFLLLLAYAAFAGAASFDCAKAQSRIEKAICADAQVSDLDEYLGRYYSAARAAVRESAACLAADQKQWLSAVRNKCEDTACLRKVYRERLAELHPLQPGATSLKNVELPRVPSLAWIIPPAADNVAAPRRPNAKPLEAKGRVINDVEKGDGFVLRTAEGATHILLLAMFFDGPSVDMLNGLAAEPNATFLARGHAAQSGGNIYYEPSRCVFLYRLP